MVNRASPGVRSLGMSPARSGSTERAMARTRPGGRVVHARPNSVASADRLAREPPDPPTQRGSGRDRGCRQQGRGPATARTGPTRPRRSGDLSRSPGPGGVSAQREGDSTASGVGSPPAVGRYLGHLGTGGSVSHAGAGRGASSLPVRSTNGSSGDLALLCERRDSVPSDVSAGRPGFVGAVSD